MTALADGPDLRRLAWGGVEVLRCAYAAVRDANWGTVAPSELEIALGSGGRQAELRWRARYEDGDLALDAEGDYVLDASGTLTASFRGTARSAFRFNRIGLCLLHPPQEFAGQGFVATAPAARTEGTLPARIGPQWIVDGLPAPLFPAVSQLELAARSGVRVRLEFEGDLFEVEDQRNWTDDSFKTYSTPLALGFPHDAEPGRRFEQRVTLTVEGRSGRSRARKDVVSLSFGAPLRRAMPPLGLGEPSHDEPLSGAAGEMLRAIHPDHVRLLVPADRDAGERAVAKARGLATTLMTKIQLVLSLDRDCGPQLEQLRASLAPIGPLVRDAVVLASDAEAAGGERVRLARERLAAVLPAARFHGGTGASFCQLNRAALDAGGLDGVVYGIHPQEHVFDDASLFETLEVQAETVRSARELFPGLAVLVGPVTLRPRFNASATGPESVRPGVLPPQVDLRQLSLLAAAWTVGSVKYLAEAGADSVTYYETTGWRGVVECDRGAPLPDLFPSRPGEVFPVYHALADVGELTGALRALESDDPLAAVAVAAEDGGVARILLANLRPQPTEVEFAALPPSRRIRRLNQESAALAADEPRRFRARWQDLDARTARLRLVLQPYEVARLDAA